MLILSPIEFIIFTAVFLIIIPLVLSEMIPKRKAYWYRFKRFIKKLQYGYKFKKDKKNKL